MNKSPAITVLMSVFNGEKYLREALESILGQTFEDFEFLIIDDASNDSTPQILQSYAEKDPRIRLERNADNQGLTKSLNRGLMMAQGEFIARMDADDISLPERLETEHNLMQSHPELAVVGSACSVIDNTGEIQDSWSPLPSYIALRWAGLFISPFPHSSAMIRRSVLNDDQMQYDEDVRYCQDFDLWSRIMSRNPVACIEDAMIMLRRHGENITTRKSQEQKQSVCRIMKRNIQELLPERSFNEDELNNIRRIHRCLRKPVQPRDFAAAHVILDLFQAAIDQWDDPQADLLKLRHRFIKLSMRAFGIRHLRALRRSGLLQRMWKIDPRACFSFFS